MANQNLWRKEQRASGGGVEGRRIMCQQRLSDKNNCLLTTHLIIPLDGDTSLKQTPNALESDRTGEQGGRVRIRQRGVQK